MDAFLLKGFYTIGALKTNRIFYPNETRWKISRYAMRINRKQETRLVTVGNRQYYVHTQECRLNGIENAVVILSFPKGAFGNLKASLFLLSRKKTSIGHLLVYVERIVSTQSDTSVQTKHRNAFKFPKAPFGKLKMTTTFSIPFNRHSCVCT